MASQKLIEARATINLSGIRAGKTALVDPNDPYIARCIANGFLVPTEKR